MWTYAKLFGNTITNGKSQTLLSDFFFGERAAVHRLKLIQRPINFDSTCFNTVEKGSKRFQVNITIQQNRTDIEANAEAICQASLRVILCKIRVILKGRGHGTSPIWLKFCM